MPALPFQRLLQTGAAALLALTLSQCVDPYGMPMQRPFDRGRADPYSDRREQYHSDLRDYSRQQGQQAYEQGYQDGRMDRSAGEQRSYLRHQQNYRADTRAAYQDGYDQGYNDAPGGDPRTNAPADPGVPPYPGGANQQTDPTYSQGYDYGLRDRVAGRPADPDAYTGRYDPRFRRSFERGYQDAFGSR